MSCQCDVIYSGWSAWAWTDPVIRGHGRQWNIC